MCSVKQLLKHIQIVMFINYGLLLLLLGFGPGVQPAAATSPTKRPLSPDHPNPALPITEVSKLMCVEVCVCNCACVSRVYDKSTLTNTFTLPEAKSVNLQLH